MTVNLDELKPSQIYHLMIQSIIPRPIAWILSSNGSNLNLAPFSYFMGISSDPPLLGVSIGKRKDGSAKDTFSNIVNHRNFVLHIPSRGEEKAVNLTSDSLPPEESEVDHAGLETVAFDDFPLPRLADAKIALACTWYKTIELDPEIKQRIVVGKIEKIFIHDEAGSSVDGKISIDSLALDPLARLGGDDYGLLGDIKTVPRNRD